MNSPNIGIITPFRDAECFIESYVLSLQNQTYRNWRCYLINDFSTDNSLQLLKTLLTKDTRFTIIKETGSKKAIGPAKSRNIGIKYCKSDFLAFCDIDDLWHPRKLEIQIKYHIVNNLDISVTGFCKFKNNITSSKNFIFPPKKISYRSLLNYNQIPMLTVLLKRSYITKGFNNCRHEDYALWLDILSNNKSIKIGTIDKILAYYRIHNKNLSKNRIRMFIWTYEALSSHGISGYRRIISIISWTIYHLYFSLLSILVIRPLKYKVNELMNIEPLNKY